LKDTKAIQEIRILEEYFKIMSKNPDKVVYGLKHVEHTLK